MPKTTRAENAPADESAADGAGGWYLLLHVQFGWWALLCYLTIGIMLETLHGFKVAWYLEAYFESRRLMWTLAHAHGVLLSLVNIAFGVTSHLLVDKGRSWCRAIASRCLMGATLLLPGGFFLGGIFIYGGDPGMGIFLVPIGAVLLFVGVFLTAFGVSRSGRSRAA